MKCANISHDKSMSMLPSNIDECASNIAKFSFSAFGFQCSSFCKRMQGVDEVKYSCIFSLQFDI